MFFITFTSFKTYTLQSKSPTAEVLYDKELKAQFDNFCMHVLDMQTMKEWSSLLQDVQSFYPTKPTNIELFTQLKKSYSQMQPTSYPYLLYKSLKSQQKTLGKQVKDLISDDQSFNGYVEIGSPCRYADYINKHINISGTRYAIHDHSSFADVAENGVINITRGFVPYDKMIPLHNYDPISLYDILDSSVDMVVCFIGLHHIPTDKIEPFIASIKRILRPGGVFLLRDHDAYNQDIFKLASTAHTVFNAIIAKSSEDEEAHEIRNFKPINYWIELLELDGFTAGSKRILQDNDPTLNTLIKFTKSISNEDTFIENLHKQDGYTRSVQQTFLTAPEWYNVDSAQAYGDFLKHTPWYDFPYLNSIKTYWHIFSESWKLARSTNSIHDILIKSDYFWTCIFVGTFMTLEYITKAILAIPVAAIMSDTADQKISIVTRNLTPQDLENLPKSVIIKEKHNDLTVLEIPRYDDFQESIKTLANGSSTIIEVGGQRIIQVKIRNINKEKDSSNIKTWADAHNIKLAYTWQLPGTKYTYGSLIVSIDKLQTLLRDASMHDFEVVYIHDF